jgi:hypothetical protein
VPTCSSIQKHVVSRLLVVPYADAEVVVEREFLDLPRP